jgi:hypothetical protein
MKKLPDWIMVILTPPALIGIWFADDVRMLRFVAFVWGINALWESIGHVAGFIVFKSESSGIHNPK